MKSSVNKNLKRVRDALLKAVNPEIVSHYEAAEKKESYVVWAEDSEGGNLGADDGKEHQAIQGTIDFYTKEEFDEKVDNIQESLMAAGISFRLNSVQYESETEYIHYEWVWEVG